MDSEMEDDINAEYANERKELMKFITYEVKKEAIRPVIDGLFGGKACYRTDKSKTLNGR